MDFLRSCYRSQMRLFSDRPDVLTWGRWAFCRDDATLIPYVHKFGASVWDTDKDGDDPPLGEVRGTRKWVNGILAPQYTGIHFCGTDAWTQGILYADRPGLPIGTDGFPTCCPHGPMPHAALGLAALAPVYQFVSASAALALRAEATAGQTVLTACESGRIPAKLVARFRTGSGCSALDGTTHHLTYHPTGLATAGWYGPLFNVPGFGDYYVFFFCSFGGWNCYVLRTSDGNGWDCMPTASTSFPPLVVSILVHGGVFSPCLAIATTVDVTET